MSVDWDLWQSGAGGDEGLGGISSDFMDWANTSSLIMQGDSGVGGDEDTAESVNHDTSSVPFSSFQMTTILLEELGRNMTLSFVTESSGSTTSDWTQLSGGSISSSGGSGTLNSNSGGSNSGTETIISSSSVNFIIVYCILFLTGATGNLSVFLSVGHELWRKRRRSRIKFLILHLSLADLFVIFFVIPIEVFWRITVFWYGGDVLCKICQFFRAFGLYLSSNVIICISLDRFYVIVSPLKAIGGMKRVKNMLVLAWTTAVIFAMPQCIVFSVRSHPLHPNLEQCATYDYFKSVEDEFLYNMMSVSVMYFAPLTVILFTYVGVLIKVTRRSREHQTVTEFQRRILQQRISRPPGIQSTTTTTSEGLMITSRILLKRIFARETTGSSVTTTSITNGGNSSPPNGGSGVPGGCPAMSSPTYRRGSQFLRMSDTASNINRSRRQAFLLTMLIVTVFVICWTPYVAMTLWYMLDWESAKIVDARVHEAFFIMAVSNSCLNPMIYGNYVRRCYYSCCARRRDTPVLSGDEQRSAGRREFCDVRHF